MWVVWDARSNKAKDETLRKRECEGRGEREGVRVVVTLAASGDPPRDKGGRDFQGRNRMLQMVPCPLPR